MKTKVMILTRISFGALFLIFGLNGFFQFIPMPEPTPAAGDFLGALFRTGFIFPVIKVIEILVGIAMIANRFTSLALVLIAPILTVITLHNFLLDPQGIPLTVVILVMFAFLTCEHRENFKQLVALKAIK